MMQTSGNVLVVEDDLNLGFLLLELLQQEGYRVKIGRDGLSGLEHIKKENFDLCILDIMMPKLDGYNLAKNLKEISPTTPFLFLTAKQMKEDKLKGYSLGAEDFIIKPFDEEELLCKINVILRRNEIKPESHPTTFDIGKYTFRYDRQEICINGRSERLTEKENEILKLLCIYKNRVLKREEAVEKIYGKKDYFLGRSFDVFISRLRKRLKEDTNLSIDNVFKVGFILNVKS